MKLIREEIETARVVITEGKNGKKNHFIEGVFLQGAIKNRNGRMYPCLLYTSPSPRDRQKSRMPSSA